MFADSRTERVKEWDEGRIVCLWVKDFGLSRLCGLL